MNPWGDRLTTFELVFPRLLLPEFNTHRMLSRNTASSRAIPIEKSLEAVRDNPFIPFHWGKNQSGMQAYEEIGGWPKEHCRWEWVQSAQRALDAAHQMSRSGLHKQIANRVLEPYLFATVVASTTSFKHLELLRTNPAAEPHFQHLAKLMVSARSESLPEALKPGEWHLPLIIDEDRSKLNLSDLKRVSTARCAAVSYVRHAERKDYEKDFALYERLTTGGHWSPLEHLATPSGILRRDCFPLLADRPGPTWIQTRAEGNFKGWKQHRKEFETEYVPDEPYTGPTR